MGFFFQSVLFDENAPVDISEKARGDGDGERFEKERIEESSNIGKKNILENNQPHDIACLIGSLRHGQTRTGEGRVVRRESIRQRVGDRGGVGGGRP